MPKSRRRPLITLLVALALWLQSLGNPVPATERLGAEPALPGAALVCSTSDAHSGRHHVPLPGRQHHVSCDCCRAGCQTPAPPFIAGDEQSLPDRHFAPLLARAAELPATPRAPPGLPPPGRGPPEPLPT